MNRTTAGRMAARAVLFGLLLGGVSAVWAADERPLKDESCTAQCDDASDKCMAAAGKDKDKRASCDKDYDACLAKCN